MKKTFLRELCVLMTVLGMVTLWTLPTIACSVPVFRYALERWAADPYQLVIYHQGEPSAELKARASELQQQAAGAENKEGANVEVYLVKVDGDMSPHHRAMLNGINVKEPTAVLAYPPTSANGRVLWTGKVDDPMLATTFRSPARSEIAKRIIAGESAVWVLVESGNAEKDEKAYAVIRDTITRMEKELKLPLEDIKNDDKFIAENTVELKIDFSIIRIKADDVNETMFREMLINSEVDLLEFEDEPMAFPVFGRGRTYYALIGNGINATQVGKSCQFITDSCSCEVKEENPGIDVVMAVEWDNHIKGSAIAEKPLPELVGLGKFAQADTDDTPKTNQIVADDTKTTNADSSTKTDTNASAENADAPEDSTPDSAAENKTTGKTAPSPAEISTTVSGRIGVGAILVLATVVTIVVVFAISMLTRKGDG